MPETIAQYQELIRSWTEKEVDIVYHPHSTYRMIKHGQAIIRHAYPNFFEVEIFTDLYGSYKTTIRYVDLFTGACKISLHQS